MKGNPPPMPETLAHILVIDDDKAMRDACFQILSRQGYRVELAASAKQGLTLLERLSFDTILLDLVMKAPAYYIIARADIIGGSTGWHRAALIDSAIRHLNEWWLIGTDYTRNWMVTGVSWSADNTDITNHYLYLGVLGGLPAAEQAASIDAG